MDLFYSRFSARHRAIIDAVTILCVLFFLGVLLWGAVSSTQYALQYNQKNYSAWSPVLWPVKLAMTAGILLMLLQVLSQFFKDLAEAMGRPIA
jgi:TRAP-type mannitol/chloroaromatic compound transport system permease small subunit